MEEEVSVIPATANGSLAWGRQWTAQWPAAACVTLALTSATACDDGGDVGTNGSGGSSGGDSGVDQGPDAGRGADFLRAAFGEQTLCPLGFTRGPTARGDAREIRIDGGCTGVRLYADFNAVEPGASGRCQEISTARAWCLPSEGLGVPEGEVRVHGELGALWVSGSCRCDPSFGESDERMPALSVEFSLPLTVE